MKINIAFCASMFLVILQPAIYGTVTGFDVTVCVLAGVALTLNLISMTSRIKAGEGR